MYGPFIFNHQIQSSNVANSLADHMPVMLAMELQSPHLKEIPLKE